MEGPDFHGKATFEVGPVELTVEFGSSEQTRKELLGGTDFIDKYLDPAEGGGALAHTAMVDHGALPAKGENATPDGSGGRPFVVVVEFGLTFTTTVPATDDHPGRTQNPALATTEHAADPRPRRGADGRGARRRRDHDRLGAQRRDDDRSRSW